MFLMFDVRGSVGGVPRSVSKMCLSTCCFSIVAFRLLFCNRALQLYFATVFYDCFLQLYIAYMCNCVLQLCIAIECHNSCNNNYKAQKVLTDEKHKKS